MSFVALISCNYNIMNKIAKVNTHIDTTQSKTIIVHSDNLPMQGIKTINIITNSRINKITTFYSKKIKLLLHYITLTHYYILNNTLT